MVTLSPAGEGRVRLVLRRSDRRIRGVQRRQSAEPTTRQHRRLVQDRHRRCEARHHRARVAEGGQCVPRGVLVGNAEEVTEILSTTYSYGQDAVLDEGVPAQLAQ